MEKPDTEVELKLRLMDPASWPTVMDAPGFAPMAESLRQESMEAIYFDTPSRTLQHAKIAYRIRKENGILIATVKAGGSCAGGLHERQEWNVAIDYPEPNIAYFDNTGAKPLLEIIAAEPLEPLFTTAFDRIKLDIETPDGSLVEVAIDTGQILAGDLREPIAEIELELKSGCPSSLLTLGAEVASRVAVMVEPRSKYFRALCLAGLTTENEEPIAHVVPSRTSPAADGLKLLIVNEIHGVFQAQEAFLSDTTAPEKLHRLYNQLQQLQAFIKLAEPMAESTGYRSHQENFRILATTFIPLWNTDVTLSLWAEFLTASAITLTPPPWLELVLREERKKLAATTATQLSQGTLTTALLSLWAWISSEQSLYLPSEPTLEEYASAQLSQCLEKLRSVGKSLTLEDKNALRDLREQCEKLRWVLEGLRLEDRRTRSLLARLRRLLDSLEAIRSSQTSTAALTSMANDHASRYLHRDTGLLIGWVAHIAHEEQEEVNQLWRRFRRAARRWLRSVVKD